MLRSIGLLLAVSAATLVSASPIVAHPAPAIATDSSGSTSTSTGFTLFAYVTDPFNELALLVQNMVLQAYHAGASYRVAVLQKADNPGRIFYLNRPPQNTSSAILTDSSSSSSSSSPAGPSVSYGFSVQSPTDFIVPEYPQEHGVNFFAGGNSSGTPAAVANTGAPYGGIFVLNEQNNSVGGGGSFLACNRTIPYYNYDFVIMVEYAYASDTTTPSTVVPDGCVPIRLVPVCAELPAVPPGSQASHEYAQTVPCYTSAAGEK